MWPRSPRSCFPRNQINRIRYFTATVDARPPDLQQPVRQQTYLRALHAIPNLSVHLGTFRTRRVRMTLVRSPSPGPKTADVSKTEEKGSDVNLASYLLLDAFRNRLRYRDRVLERRGLEGADRHREERVGD